MIHCDLRIFFRRFETTNENLFVFLSLKFKVCFCFIIFFVTNLFCQRNVVLQSALGVHDEPGFQRQKNMDMFDVSAFTLCVFVEKNEGTLSN